MAHTASSTSVAVSLCVVVSAVLVAVVAGAGGDPSQYATKPYANRYSQYYSGTTGGAGGTGGRGGSSGNARSPYGEYSSSDRKSSGGTSESSYGTSGGGSSSSRFRFDSTAPTTKPFAQSDDSSDSGSSSLRSSAAAAKADTVTDAPLTWRRASAKVRKDIDAFEAALDSWRDVQDDVYYNPQKPAKPYKDSPASLGDAVETIIVRVPGYHGQPASSSSSSSSASSRAANATRLLSLVQACAEDSKRLCDDPDPFMAATCLQLHRNNLSDTCREYHSAKMICFMDVTRLGLCTDATKKFECLDEHRDYPKLSRPCVESTFMQYIRSDAGRKAAKAKKEKAAADAAAKLRGDDAANSNRSTAGSGGTVNMAADGDSNATSSDADGSDAAGTPSVQPTNSTKQRIVEGLKKELEAQAKDTTEGEQPTKKKQLPSFVKACGPDARKFCESANPFAESACLNKNRDSLTPLCRDYNDAKTDCYADLKRHDVCGSTPLFKCLDVNRDHPKLSRACLHSQFMDYVRTRPRVAASATPEPSSTPVAGHRAL